MHELIVPAQETTEPSVKQIFAQVEKLDKKVRSWAQDLVNVLPKGLPLNPEELDLLTLYLARQHRLNLEIDASQNLGYSFTDRIKAIAPFIKDDPKIVGAAHQSVSAGLEVDIDRAFESFCKSHNVDPDTARSIDWKVRIRYTAQSLHAIAAKMDLSKIDMEPQRFQLSIEARDCAAGITEKRSTMLSP